MSLIKLQKMLRERATLKIRKFAEKPSMEDSTLCPTEDTFAQRTQNRLIGYHSSTKIYLEIFFFKKKIPVKVTYSKITSLFKKDKQELKTTSNPLAFHKFYQKISRELSLNQFLFLCLMIYFENIGMVSERDIALRGPFNKCFGDGWVHTFLVKKSDEKEGGGLVSL